MAAARELAVDQRIEDLGLLAQTLGQLEHVLLGCGVDLAQGGDESMPHTTTDIHLAVVGLVVTPTEIPLLAVGGGLLTRDYEQRSHQVADAWAHAEQRPAAR